MRTVVLGAGIGGLAAAIFLKENFGEDCDVYEQAATPGGLCRTQRYDGFRFDEVSHVLHFRSQVAEQLVHRLLNGSFLRCERKASIHFRDRYVPYPFQTNLGFLPVGPALSCLRGYAGAWLSRLRNGHTTVEDFGQWIRGHFGEGVARHFMYPYNRKLWGVTPDEMSSDWVGRFVPSTSLMGVIGGLIRRRTNTQGYNRTFLYPLQGGTQVLIDKLASQIEPIHLNHQAVEVDLEGQRVRFQDGKEITYDRLLSTLPLKGLAQHAKGLPDELRQAAAALRTTSLLALTFCIRRPQTHPFHWVYFPEAEYPFFRVVFPSNFCPMLAPSGCSIVSVEISNPDMDRKDEIVDHVKTSLIRLGYIADLADVAHMQSTFVPYAYPIHDLRREESANQLLEFLKSRGVWSMGRFGGWRYSSVDDVIEEASRTVEQICRVPAGRAVAGEPSFGMTLSRRSGD